MKRRILIFFFALVLISTMLPWSSIEIYAETSSGNCGAQGDNLTWEFNSESGVLTISGSGAMADYAWGGPWNSVRNLITSVSLPDGLTTIGSAAFSMCYNLVSVTIPESVTIIGNKAFYACTGLTSVIFPDELTAIGEKAFYSCNSLVSIEIPNGITTICEETFSSCSSLSSVVIPNTTTSIENNAFSYCKSLTSVILPEQLTDLGTGVFAHCTELCSVFLPDGLTEIKGNTFSQCSKLTAITFPDSLLSIDSNAFYYCRALTSISLPEGLTTIGEWAFYSCSSIRSVTLPESLSSVGEYAFGDCSSLNSVFILNDSCNIFDEAHTLGSKNTTVIFGQTGSAAESYATRYGYSFAVSGNSMRYFSGVCGSQGDNLTWIFDTETGLLSISGSGQMADYYFYFDLGGEYHYYNTDAPCAQWYAFHSDITALSLPADLTYIGTGAFRDCVNLTSVTLPDTVSVIGVGAFSNCTGLTELLLSENLATIGSHAFNCCTGLSELILPEGLTETGYSSFEGCSSLTSISFPESLNTISAFTFYDCDGLSKLVFPETITTIGEWALGDCANLNSVTVFNSNCEIDMVRKYTLGNPLNTVIRGYAGSTAEVYAKKHGYTFQVLFDDVPDDAYYAAPVAWAYKNGITAGVGNGRFGPNDSCTREQIMTFLWIAAGRPEPGISETPFQDVQEDQYYYQALLWAADNGITSGIAPDRFGVGLPCTRAQAITFLWAFQGRPEPDSFENPFSDVTDNAYFCKAVLWAVENGVTNGTSASSFSPKNSCSRAQFITFLYRTVGN